MGSNQPTLLSVNSDTNNRAPSQTSTPPPTHHPPPLTSTRTQQNNKTTQPCSFGRDVVVDLVCYRRNGHNELDDARATLPLTCAAIDAHAPVLELYAARLQAEGAVAAAELEAWRRGVDAGFEAEFEAARAGAYRESARQFLTATWQGDALAVRGSGGGGGAGGCRISRRVRA